MIGFVFASLQAIPVLAVRRRAAVTSMQVNTAYSHACYSAGTIAAKRKRGSSMQRLGRRKLFTMALFSFLFGRGAALAKEPAPSFADVGALRASVIDALTQRKDVSSVTADPTDPAKFKVTMGQWWSQADVSNLFNYLKAYPKENARLLIGRFVNSIVESRDSKVADENIVAVIRARDYVDQSLSEGIDLLHEPLTADLVVLYMADRPDSMAAIGATDLPGKDLASVRTIALNNLRQWLPKVQVDESLPSGALFFVGGNPMLSTGLILLDEFWQTVAGHFRGDILIALPRKDQLFLFDDGDAAARASAHRLIAATFEDNFNLLSRTLYARRDGKIVPVAN